MVIQILKTDFQGGISDFKTFFKGWTFQVLKSTFGGNVSDFGTHL